MKRALIFKLGAIGDVVMAVPAARLLYEQGFEIHWACGAAVKPLLDCYSWLTPVPVNDDALLKGSAVARLQALIRLWPSLLAHRYDLCATLYYDSRYKLLTLPVMAKKKISLSRSKRELRLLPGRHHTDEYVRILLGTLDSAKSWSTAPFPPDRLPPSPLSLKTAPVRIAIVPGGASNTVREQILRRWPTDRYALLAKAMLDRGWDVVLIGGPDDIWVRPHFDGLAVRDCIGNFTLPEVVSAFDSCDVVVSHDTGPLHLAGLSSAAVIGLFGPTIPDARLPRRGRAAALWGGEGFACRPCYDDRDFAPCLNNECMQTISPESVLRTIDKLLL